MELKRIESNNDENRMLENDMKLYKEKVAKTKEEYLNWLETVERDRKQNEVFNNIISQVAPVVRTITHAIIEENNSNLETMNIHENKYNELVINRNELESDKNDLETNLNNINDAVEESELQYNKMYAELEKLNTSLLGLVMEQRKQEYNLYLLNQELDPMLYEIGRILSREKELKQQIEIAKELLLIDEANHKEREPQLEFLAKFLKIKIEKIPLIREVIEKKIENLEAEIRQTRVKKLPKYFKDRELKSLEHQMKSFLRIKNFETKRDTEIEATYKDLVSPETEIKTTHNNYLEYLTRVLYWRLRELKKLKKKTIPRIKEVQEKIRNRSIPVHPLAEIMYLTEKLKTFKKIKNETQPEDQPKDLKKAVEQEIQKTRNMKHKIKLLECERDLILNQNNEELQELSKLNEQCDQMIIDFQEEISKYYGILIKNKTELGRRESDTISTDYSRDDEDQNNIT